LPKAQGDIGNILSRCSQERVRRVDSTHQKPLHRLGAGLEFAGDACRVPRQFCKVVRQIDALLIALAALAARVPDAVAFGLRE
jgi:hypothetical protein